MYYRKLVEISLNFELPKSKNMKSLKFIFLFAFAALVVACSNDNSGEQLGPPPAPINPNALNNTSAPSSTTGAVAGVQHYTCPNNCEGSGGDTQGTCPVCGTAYLHNQAYHAQNAAQQPITPPANQSTTPAATTAGVFHYTCPNGCAGGAGTAQACATCGTMLAHNQAFHAQPQATTPTPQAAPPGVFHYTCPNGCAGGAANAQACSTCGTMLAHNQAYHSAAPAGGGATAAPGGKSPLYINNN